MDDGTERPIANFEGRRGSMAEGHAMEGEYLYFTWRDDIGDIWVMDVETNAAD